MQFLSYGSVLSMIPCKRFRAHDVSFLCVKKTQYPTHPSWLLTCEAALPATLCDVVFVTMHFLNSLRERSERSKNQLKAFVGFGGATR